MRPLKVLVHKLFAIVLITLFLSISLYVTGYTQQSDDSDPLRWRRVKSWTGTFNYSCKDSRTDSLDDGTVTYTWDDNINGSFTLDQLTPQGRMYVWNGRGRCSGTIHEVTEVTAVADESGGTCTETEDTTQAPPLVEAPGYFLKINFTDNTYFFQSETV